MKPQTKKKKKKKQVGLAPKKCLQLELKQGTTEVKNGWQKQVSKFNFCDLKTQLYIHYLTE